MPHSHSGLRSQGALLVALALSSLASLPTTSAQTAFNAARFGGSLVASKQPAQAEPRPEYARPPLTIDGWARLDSRNGFNILVAHGPKESPTHWELYTTAGSGSLAAFIPAVQPSVLDSKVNACDGKWHHVALVYEADRVRLYLDGKSILDSPIQRQAEPGEPGPLWMGAYPPQNMGCDGRIDELRIRRGALPPTESPTAPPKADAVTLGLWSFDALADGQYADASPLDNPARPGAAPPPPAEFRDGAPPSYRAAHPALQVQRLDTSTDESFIAVRIDAAGRVFVGGREALFVYEPDDKGGYAPRRELFRFPPHSWIGDIEIRGDDLYVATAPALYRLPGARRLPAGQKATAEKIVWGTPVDLHVTFHGLAFGPQGDLYFNSGDPLLNYGDFNRADHWGHWTVYSGPTGEPTPYTGVGGVFRVKPDGRQFRVVAGGLRGSDGVAFDRRYELFTNDNDHESLPDRYTPYRVLHVARGADFAWPRGWTARRSPDRSDLLEIANPGFGRGVPVGQAYHDETLLPEPFRDSLLIAQWGHRSIDAARIEPRGASYAVTEQPLLIGEGRARPVGVAVGPDGRVFATIAYMAQNEGSPVYPSELVVIAPAEADKGTAGVAYEPPDANAEKLWSELSTSSWSRRDVAHRELIRRGGPALAEAPKRLAALKRNDPARLHMPWLIAASGAPEAATLLNSLREDTNPEVRLQAVRALGDAFRIATTPAPFAASLADNDARVRLAALSALFDHAGNPPDAVLSGPARSDDTYLRQIATRLIAVKADAATLARLQTAEDDAARLAGVLAAGFRLTVPNPTDVLPQTLPLTYESGNALFSIPYADGTVNLRDLGRVGSFTMAGRWKALPHSDEEEQLFASLMRALDDRNDRVRLQAAYFLRLLNDPRSEPAVAKATGEVEAKRLAAAPPRPIAEVWQLGPITGGTGRSPESGAIDLNARYRSGEAEVTWLKANDPAGAYRLADGAGASYFHVRLQSGAERAVNLFVRSDDPVMVWHNGKVVYENSVGSIPGFRNATRLDLGTGSNDVLVRVKNRPGGSKATLELQALDGVAVELPEALGIAGLAERLKASGGAGAEAIPAAFLEVDWSKAAAEGNRERGRKLFSADGIGCAKCHALNPGDVGGGAPSLADAGKRFTAAYLVESVLTPSRQVAPVFQGTIVATTDGRVISGLILNEGDSGLELLQTDATRVKIPRAEIESRKPMDGSPMPAGLVKSTEELRDLLSFLLGATEPASTPSGGGGR